MKRIIPLILIFVCSSAAVFAQLTPDQKARIDTFGKIIDSKNLSSQKVYDSIRVSSTYTHAPITADQFKYLEELFSRRFGNNPSILDKYVLAWAEMEWYTGSKQIGKALVAVDKFYQRVKNLNDKDLLAKSYNLYAALYARSDMAAEWAKYEGMYFHLQCNGKSASEIGEFAGGYGWVLTQAGWDLKNETMQDSAALLLKMAKDYSLTHNGQYGKYNEVFEKYAVYLLSLARLKRYDELLAVGREAYNWVQANPLVGAADKKRPLSVFISRIGSAFTGLNNHDSAFYYLNLPVMFDSAKNQDNTLYPPNGMYYILDNMSHLVNAHVHFKEYKEAAALLDAALFSKDKFSYSSTFGYLYNMAAPIYAKAGMPDRAIECFTEGKRIKDSLQEEENKVRDEANRISTTLQIEAVTEAARLEKEEIQTKSKLRTYYLVGCIFLVLVPSLFVYHSNRQKQKANIVLEERNKIITNERNRSDELLLNILPEEVAEELKAKGNSDARLYEEVTVLFTDFVNFTMVSERLTPRELVEELGACFRAFDGITGKYNIEKIKTIGDAYLAVAGLPTADPNHAENVVRAALEIRDFTKDRVAKLGAGTFEIRIGIHSGSVVAGIVGIKKFAYDIWGDTVNTAARMEQNSEAGKINISQTTYELVKDKFACEYRGEIDAKGKGMLKMYYVS